MRTSNVRIHKRVTEAGRELPAASFPSGRVVLQGKGTIILYESEERCPAERAVKLPPNTRAGVLLRHVDESGVSGTGVVADFVRFPDGTVVQETNEPSLQPDDSVSSGSAGHEPDRGPYTLEASTDSSSATYEWDVSACARVDLAIAITSGGQVSISEELCQN